MLIVMFCSSGADEVEMMKWMWNGKENLKLNLIWMVNDYGSDVYYVDAYHMNLHTWR